MKTFAVVEFLIDHGVSALPTKWINNLDPDRKSGSVFWPPEEDDKVKSGSELLKIKPQTDWRLLEVLFLGFFGKLIFNFLLCLSDPGILTENLILPDSFEVAKRKVELAIEDNQLSTLDTTDQEASRKSRKLRHKRQFHGSISSSNPKKPRLKTVRRTESSSDVSRSEDSLQGDIPSRPLQGIIHVRSVY
jgi:hypothetical protein